MYETMNGVYRFNGDFKDGDKVLVAKGLPVIMYNFEVVNSADAHYTANILLPDGTIVHHRYAYMDCDAITRVEDKK